MGTGRLVTLANRPRGRGTMRGGGGHHIRPPWRPARRAREHAPGVSARARCRRERPGNRCLAVERRRGRLHTRSDGLEGPAPTSGRGVDRSRAVGLRRRPAIGGCLRGARYGLRVFRRRQGPGRRRPAARRRPQARNARPALGLLPRRPAAARPASGPGGPARPLGSPTRHRRAARTPRPRPCGVRSRRPEPAPHRMDGRVGVTVPSIRRAGVRMGRAGDAPSSARRYAWASTRCTATVPIAWSPLSASGPRKARCDAAQLRVTRGRERSERRRAQASAANWREQSSERDQES